MNNALGNTFDPKPLPSALSSGCVGAALSVSYLASLELISPNNYGQQQEQDQQEAQGRKQHQHNTQEQQGQHQQQLWATGSVTHHASPSTTPLPFEHRPHTTMAKTTTLTAGGGVGSRGGGGGGGHGGCGGGAITSKGSSSPNHKFGGPAAALFYTSAPVRSIRVFFLKPICL